MFDVQRTTGSVLFSIRFWGRLAECFASKFCICVECKCPYLMSKISIRRAWRPPIQLIPMLKLSAQKFRVQLPGHVLRPLSCSWPPCLESLSHSPREIVGAYARDESTACKCTEIYSVEFSFSHAHLVDPTTAQAVIKSKGNVSA